METIKHQVTIDAPAHTIYALVATKAGIRKWLTKADGWRIEGEENVGGILLFYFHENHHEMKILKLDPNKEVVWECTAGDPEWLDTLVSFKIEGKGEQCILQFAQSGWEKQTEFYKQCDKVWKGCVTDIKKLAEAEAFVRSLHHH
jgi:uncharacterized protein YndB with AHSA1/START domain